jgi:hypothetical protein
MNFNNLTQEKHSPWKDPWNKKISATNKIYIHSIEKGEQIFTRSLQDKYHHGETLKTMKGAQGPTRMSRLG